MSKKSNERGSRGFVWIAALAILASVAIWFFSDGDAAMPKPRGYFRIELPQQKYRSYESECPLTMDVSQGAQMELFRDRKSPDSCWFNIYYPKLNARVHCSYIEVNGRLNSLIDDAYGFAAKHEMKASALRRTKVADSARKVYGIVYDIEGDAASSLQFFLTDSTDHFLRGALYFFNSPNADSIAPALDFVRADVIRLTETLRWR